MFSSFLSEESTTAQLLQLFRLKAKDYDHLLGPFKTELEHIWATAVEVYGTIKNASFKTGEGDHHWKEFFKLLSSFFAMLEYSPVLDEHKTLSKSAYHISA